MNNSNGILIGRHVSLKSPDYLLGSINDSLSYEANAFMIYLGSPQSTFRKSFEYLKVDQFKDVMKENGIMLQNIIVHAPYLINLANFSNKCKLDWSISFLKKELAMMDRIGLSTIVIHPGSSLGFDRNSSLLSISDSLDKVLNCFPFVRIALETMSGRGNEVGANFQEIKFIIDNAKNSDRIGICLDTCHAYSAGYDVKDKFDIIIDEIDELIGLEKLWVIHLNDSASEFKSKKDRHANIGYGSIGFDSLARIVHHKRLRNVVKILETPIKNGFYKQEIILLKNFVSSDQD